MNKKISKNKMLKQKKTPVEKKKPMKMVEVTRSDMPLVMAHLLGGRYGFAQNNEPVVSISERVAEAKKVAEEIYKQVYEHPTENPKNLVQ
jgi:hypothetical protein